MHNIKLLGYRIGIQFHNNFLVGKQKNYATKILNACIVYDLDDWSKIPADDFKLKKCLLGVTNIEENSDKSKWRYSVKS